VMVNKPYGTIKSDGAVAKLCQLPVVVGPELQ
jgi:hypothetical protein